jgi:hypothetical protein
MTDQAFASFSALPSVSSSTSTITKRMRSSITKKDKENLTEHHQRTVTYYGTKFDFSLKISKGKRISSRVKKVCITLTMNLWRKLLRVSRDRLRIVMASYSMKVVDFYVAEMVLELEAIPPSEQHPTCLARDIHRVLCSF